MRRRFGKALFVALLSACTFSVATVSADAAYIPGPPSNLNAEDIAVVENEHVLLGEFDKRYKINEQMVEARTPSQRHARARQLTINELITRIRVRLESVQLGIIVPEQDVQARKARIKRLSFPDEADYQRFLLEWGMTDEDVTEQVRESYQLERLENSWVGRIRVRRAEIVNEFRRHRRRYDVPASRDLRLVYNSSRAVAARAARKLRSGLSWRSAARRYSQDSYSRSRGGRFPGVVRKQFPTRLDRAVFRAKKGQIVGPVRTQYGYYVFEVTRINKRRSRTLRQAKRMIRKDLLDRKRQQRIARAKRDFGARWKPVTVCRATHVTSNCGQIVP